MGGWGDLTAFAVALAVRGSILVAMALAAAVLLRRTGAAVRHSLWSVTMLALLALPLLASLLPPLPLLPASATIGVPDPGAAGPGELDPATAGPRSETEAGQARLLDPVAARQPRTLGRAAATQVERGPPSMPAILFVIWSSGALVVAFALVRSLLGARRLRRRAITITAGPWLLDLRRTATSLGVTRPVALLVSDSARTPMTGGLIRPAIILPRAALRWSGERRRLSLAHELVHVRRGDALRLLATRVAVAIYWFQPLVWIAARLAALAREQACDEEVLSQGHRPSAYARLLLDLSANRHEPALVLGMTQRPHLEQRVMAILDPDRRSRPARIGALAVTTMILLAVSIATASPQTPPPAPAAPVAAVDGAIPAPPVPAGGSGVVTAAPPAAAPTTMGGETAPRAPAAVPQQPSGCSVDGLRGNFSGSLSYRDGDRTEMVGYHDGDRVIQRHVDGVRLCMRVHGPVEMASDHRSIVGMLDSGRVWLESETASGSRRLEIRAGDNGLQYDYAVDGRPATFDQDASQWRDRMLGVLADHWEIGQIRGEVSSLRGKISSIRGRRSSLRGRISSIRGHVSSLRGRISSTKGRVSSLRGQISSARGRVSSMRGRISSIRGHESSMRGRLSSMSARLSGLRSAARSTRDAETRRRLESEMEEVRASMEQLEREIEALDTEAKVAEVQREIDAYDVDSKVAEVERELAAYDVDARVAEIEREIAEYDADARVAEVERELAALDVEGKVAEIERQIEALDAERRIETIEARLEPAWRDLRRSLGESR